ncbi:MAG TPA: aspartate-semialdehyde dehydrogenase [Bdellovibrionota bacterium]|nr:aspartate-semialdehyde dehydrogenase [Bdellovibrionota bacterium]
MNLRNEGWNLAIVGATGAVGQEALKILEERKTPLKNLYLFASSKNVGRKMSFRGEEYTVCELDSHVFEKTLDVAFFSAGRERSLEFGGNLARQGVRIIDNSSAFRMDPHVALVVPEVNWCDYKNYKNKNIIANPNCSTIQLVMALKPLQKYGLKRVVVSTYQAVSGAGLKAMEELKEQTRDYLSGKELKNQVFPHKIAFNCLPHIDKFDDDFYSFEEKKVMQETKKILGESHLAITCTAVRVPVLGAHSESVNIEFEKPFDLDVIKKELAGFPGVKVLDNPKEHVYPLNIEAIGKNEVFVGRLRRDSSVKSGLNLWIVADNIRKGAALNAIQILEHLS